MIKYTRTLTVLLNTEINFKEIALFRGAVLKRLGEKADLLYHNHTTEQSFRYSYPLVQYKRIKGKAAIVCIDKAVDLIGQLLTQTDNSALMIGDRNAKWEISHIHPTRLLLQTWDKSFCYHIDHWLPLNSKNFLLYQSMESDIERMNLLERILKGNLLSMLKGLGIHLDKEILVSITQMSEPYISYNKGIGMTSFNADFTCNLTIPNNVGIGKNASIGFGVVHQVRK